MFHGRAAEPSPQMFVGPCECATTCQPRALRQMKGSSALPSVVAGGGYAGPVLRHTGRGDCVNGPRQLGAKAIPSASSNWPSHGTLEKTSAIVPFGSSAALGLVTKQAAAGQQLSPRFASRFAKP